MNEPPAVPISHFDGLLGTEWLDDGTAPARARLAVREELRQPYGIVHGGVISSLVESLCSRATARAVFEEGKIAIGQAIEVSFLRPTRDGHLEARATARHRGRTTWVWEAEVRGEDGKVVALAKMTMAVRSRPEGG